MKKIVKGTVSPFFILIFSLEQKNGGSKFRRFSAVEVEELTFLFLLLLIFWPESSFFRLRFLLSSSFSTRSFKMVMVKSPKSLLVKMFFIWMISFLFWYKVAEVFHFSIDDLEVIFEHNSKTKAAA